MNEQQQRMKKQNRREKAEARPQKPLGDMTKSELRKELLRLSTTVKALRRALEGAAVRIEDLKAELAECRARVTRYAEEAMVAREPEEEHG